MTPLDFVTSIKTSTEAFSWVHDYGRVDPESKGVVLEDWPFAGPDIRTFEARLLSGIKYIMRYSMHVVNAAIAADVLYLSCDAPMFFPETPVKQEHAWGAFFLAAAAGRARQHTDSKEIHVKHPKIIPFHIFFFEKERLANFLLEREQTLVDALLLRYKNIADLAPLPGHGDIKEVTAAQSFQLKVETAALVSYLPSIISI
jgi:hypothetical protein